MSDRLKKIRERFERATPGPFSGMLRVLLAGEPIGSCPAEDIAFLSHASVDVPYLLSLLDEAKSALTKLSQCSGGCEGPLGCMCKAPIARACLAKLEGGK